MIFIDESDPVEMRRYFEELRAMTPDEKAKLVQEFNDEEERFLRMWVRTRHPDYEEDKVKLAIFLMRHGEETYRQFFDTDIEI